MIENTEIWRIIRKDQNVPNKFYASVALIDGYQLVNNDWLADINWPDHLTCSSYSVKRETPWEALDNKSSNFTRSTTSAASYGRQWVKICHIFCEQVMINLATLSATGYLLALKRLRWDLISTNTLFFVSLKFLISFDDCPPMC